MALFGPVAGQVGLAVLFQPSSTAVVARAGCYMAGVIYPVYASFKTIEAKGIFKAQQDKQWLTYWTIYSTLQVVEQYAEKLLARFPWYYHFKLAFLLWLQLPSYQGARRLYTELLRPHLLKYQPKVDARLAQLQRAMTQPELVALSLRLREMAKEVPLLRWFAQSPDED